VLHQGVEKLPTDVTGRVRELSVLLADGSQKEDRSVIREATVLAAALGGYDDDVLADRLVGLLQGDDIERVRALSIIENLGIREEHVGVLVPLTADSDPALRGWAAALLAIHVDRGGASALAVAALNAAAEDPGTNVPEAITAAFKDLPTTEEARRLLVALREHRSATVRNAAAACLANEVA
jgi:HEAT repeat protein